MSSTPGGELGTRGISQRQWRASQDPRWSAWLRKRGGARVAYYWAVRKDLILLLFANPKNVMADLSLGQIGRRYKFRSRRFRNVRASGRRIRVIVLSAAEFGNWFG